MLVECKCGFLAARRDGMGNLTSWRVRLPGGPARDGLHEESWAEKFSSHVNLVPRNSAI